MTNPDNEWMTDEIRGLLDAIQGDHVAKKRMTAILVGFAKATGDPITKVFGQPGTCNESVWWRSWHKDPAILAVVKACEARVMTWTEEQTAILVAKYANERKRDVARYAAEAPAALAAVMTDKGQRGSDRINAAVTLVKLADPVDASTVGTVAGAIEQSQMVNVGRFEEALQRAYSDPESEGDGEGAGGVPAVGGGDRAAGGNPAGTVI